MYSVAIQCEVNKGMQNDICMRTIKIQLLTSQTCTQGAVTLIQESIYTCASMRNTY